VDLTYSLSCVLLSLTTPWIYQDPVEMNSVFFMNLTSDMPSALVHIGRQIYKEYGNHFDTVLSKS
jgi:hypothetical protein